MAGDSIDVQLGEMVSQERVAKLEAQNEKLRAFLDHYKTVDARPARSAFSTECLQTILSTCCAAWRKPSGADYTALPNKYS